MTTVKDREIFYEAMLSRDSRFDGRFFVGVTTTGIYCRPICPAPKPKLENVKFYAGAAGAEAAGFRPCKRCRPDASPGTPVWTGTSATVSKALQFIGDGYLDEHNVTQLGETLGITDRQLRRLFTHHLGASPIAVALTRRLDFARKLIDETNISMTETAFASGFESIRRFNDAVKKRFGESPTTLRHSAQKSKKENNGKNLLALRLPFRPPLDWAALLGYLKARQTAGVEVIDDNRYCRSIRFGEHQGIMEVTRPGEANHLELTLQMEDTVGLMTIVRRVRRIFDLEADPMCISGHLKKDPAMAPVVSAFPGLRLPGGWDNFEIAVRTVIGQQVSIKGAGTVTGRLVERLGEQVTSSFVPGITHLFPTPEAIAGADLTGIGMPGSRARTIVRLAEKAAAGEIVLEGIIQPHEVRKQLMQVPGIGAWTVEYISMRALREPDAFPATDLVLKRSVETMSLSPDHWRPWRAYAAMYLYKASGGQNPFLRKKGSGLPKTFA